MAEMRVMMLVLIIILFLIICGGWLEFGYRRKKECQVTLHQEINFMDQLNGYEFEKYTVWLLKKNHFTNIVHTAQNDDYGLDVIADHDHVRYGFQCKHYRKRQVGRKALRITADGARYYHVQRAVILTNRTFSPVAKNYQKFFRVQLWDRSVLIQLIKAALAR